MCVCDKVVGKKRQDQKKKAPHFFDVFPCLVWTPMVFVPHPFFSFSFFFSFFFSDSSFSIRWPGLSICPPGTKPVRSCQWEAQKLDDVFYLKPPHSPFPLSGLRFNLSLLLCVFVFNMYKLKCFFYLAEWSSVKGSSDLLKCGLEERIVSYLL